MTDIEELRQAISGWKRSVEAIAAGWDCIEEYTHQLTFRESLQDLLDKLHAEEHVPEEFADQIGEADRAFMDVTEESGLCVWDCGPMFRYYDENNIEIIPINQHDRERYWYYYRWQPDCPMSWKDMDAETYQKQMYGLDFVNMTHDQLIDVVRKEVARWNQRLRELKDRWRKQQGS